MGCCSSTNEEGGDNCVDCLVTCRCYPCVESSFRSSYSSAFRRRLLSRGSEMKEDWIVLNSQDANFDRHVAEDYTVGKELGRGRASCVFECTKKGTSTKFAVKSISKRQMEAKEKELLKTEVAVLKLVSHPHIIQLKAVYESNTHVHIVTEFCAGGTLLDKITGKPRFKEEAAVQILQPLVEAIAYLHDLGIAHRDIKPENVLCGEDLTDIKLADFGFSKILPGADTTITPCGTLSYVAPDVLGMGGYGKEADLWSVGVILFLLLVGDLPFDGRDKQQTVHNTMKGEIKLKRPHTWKSLSEEARELITGLLNKNPSERFTAREVLSHPWMSSHYNRSADYTSL